MHWLRLFFVVFQEMQCLLTFHYDVGRLGIEIYPCIKFCVFFVNYMHIHMPLRIYWLRLFFVVLQSLHNFNHDDVRHVTELYLSTKFYVCQSEPPTS